MSSTYGLICLGHDPAIEFGDHENEYAPEPMLAIAKNPESSDWAAAHARCDLLVAAYSYPIVRVACPGKSDRGGACAWHVDPCWIEADVLRLLIAGYRAEVAQAVTEPFDSRCWKRERVLRLAPLLGLGDGPTRPPASVADAGLRTFRCDVDSPPCAYCRGNGYIWTRQVAPCQREAVREWCPECHASATWLAEPPHDGGRPEPPIGSVLDCADGSRFVRLHVDVSAPLSWRRMDKYGELLGAYTWAQARAIAGDGAEITEGVR